MRAAWIFVAVALHACVCVQAVCPPGDYNGDCWTDMADLKILAEIWLTPLETSDDPNEVAYIGGNELAAMARGWRTRGCPIVINEVLAHSHAAAPDWIELHNTSDIAVDISGWLLSDDKNNLDKHQIAAGMVLGPREYIVFYENTHFGNPSNPDTHRVFALSENGETLYLSSGGDEAFGDCLIEETFGASETGCSFGRYRKSDGTYHFVTMSYPTPGRANAYPRVGPVVINEVMYHPLDDTDTEYVELLNVSDGPVTLFDFELMQPWRFTDNSGIDFWFPVDPPVTLQKNEHVLLARNAAAVRDLGVPAAVQVFGWNSGRLANQGERLELFKPGEMDSMGVRYWIEADCLVYSDGSHDEDFADGIDPWPVEADGSGPSLNRLFPSRYGNDPNNWQATVPTPGTVND